MTKDTITWKHKEGMSLPHIMREGYAGDKSDATVESFNATIKKNGYEVRLWGNGKWTATVRCARIGYTYDTKEDAIQACCVRAGLVK